jgi:hypothetical protein
MRWRFAALIITAALGSPLISPGAAGAGESMDIAWGNVNCDAGVNPVDSLMELRFDAGLSTTKADPACPDIGASVTADDVARVWGDVDCSGTVNPVDSLKLLRKDAGLSVAKVDASCDDIGVVVSVGPGGPNQGITFAGLVPSSIDGEELSVAQVAGDSLQAQDAGWADYFDQFGLDPGGFGAATSVPHADSDLGIRVTALTADTDWTAALAAFVAAIEAAEPGSPYTIETVMFGSREVVKVSQDADESIATYYHASGDTLWIVDSSDEALVQRLFEALPGVPAAAPLAAPAGDNGPLPGSTFVVGVLLRQPENPVCVAEPYGRQLLVFTALDGVYQVPVPSTMALTGIVAGSLREPSSSGGGPTFNYQAETYGSPEFISMQIVAWAGGQGFGQATFPVQHCLNGDWMDGDRTIRISHTLNQVVAALIEGEICDETGGNDFTGMLSGDVLTGNDLKVCNPDECVEAGHLPNSELASFTAFIATDGNSANVEWQGKFYDLVYDDDNNLVGCPVTSTPTNFFSIERLTFGPGFP